MILGVDHIALSCAELRPAVEALAKHGYVARFVELGLHNAEPKRPFLRRHSATHDIALLQSERGVAVELTCHGPPAQSAASAYQVLFSGLGAGFEARSTPHENWAVALREAVSEPSVEAVTFEKFGAQLWRAGSGEAAEVRAVLVPCSELARSVEFWTKGVGCRLLRQEAGWAHLRFVSPVVRWMLDVVLAVSASAEPPMLDDIGFPALALMSNRIDADAGRALLHGGHTRSDTFELAPGGNDLRIVLLRGPDHELIELLEPRRAVAAKS